jgi:3-hydroxyacyl-CoA dehydrogenase
MTSADYTSHGAVAVIRLDNPPVNALSASVRKGIADGLERAADADSCPPLSSRARARTSAEART